MAPQLPGFFYDEEKKKYFKILPNHVAPKGAKYSMEGLRRDGEKKSKRTTDSAYRDRVKRTKVRESHLDTSLSIKLMMSSVGVLRTGINTNAVWATHLERRVIVPGSQEINVHAVAKDPWTRYIFCANNFEGGVSSALAAMYRPSEDDTDGTYRWAGTFSWAPMNYAKFLLLSPSRTLITTVERPRGTEVWFTQLREPTTPKYELCDLLGPRNTVMIYPRLLNNELGCVWSVAIAPEPSKRVAITGEQGIFITEPEGTYRKLHDSDRECLAVAWQDENVLICGSRSGDVKLMDTRIHESVLRLQHGSCITHIAQMGGPRTVIAGLENRMNLYDLRWTKPPSSASNDITQPFLNFPAYSNRGHTNDRVGFDVSINRNLVAAATDNDINATVQVFDAGTGEEIYNCKATDSEGSTATCVRFVNDDLELLIANGSKVESVAWDDGRDSA